MRFKKILSMLLALCMLMGLIPLTAMAAEESVIDNATGDLVLQKTAVLEDDGSYTIQLEAYATGDPVRTQVKTGKPLQIAIVVDQSGSMKNNLATVKDAITKFIEIIAANGRNFGVEHHVAIVGFASNESDGATRETGTSIAGGSEDEWVNTGIFDSTGNFKNHITGTEKYTLHEGTPNPLATDHYHFVKLSDGTYSEMQYHSEVYLAMPQPTAQDENLYYYVDGVYYPVTHAGDEKGYYVQIENSTMQQDRIYYVGDEKTEIEYGTCYEQTTYNPRSSSFGSTGTLYETGDILYVLDNGVEKKLTCTRSGWFLGYTYTWKDDNGETYNLTKGDTVYTQTEGWHDATSHLVMNITNNTKVYQWQNAWTYVNAKGQEQNVPADGIIYQRSENVWTYYDESSRAVIWNDEDVYLKQGGELTAAEYRDALMPVSDGENGQGEITAALLTAVDSLSASGATRVSYGLEMAEDIFVSNHGNTPDPEHGHVVVVFTDGQPGFSEFDTTEANATLEIANRMKMTNEEVEGGYGAEIYTVGLFNNLASNVNLTQTERFLNGVSSNYHNVSNMTQVSNATASENKYFQETEDLTQLNDIFTNITIDSTTTSTQTTLNDTSIMRDILGTGMELMPGTTISAELIPGTIVSGSNEIRWNTQAAKPLDMSKTLSLGETREEFDAFVNEENAKIKVYNINENTGAQVGEYHPHTIDVSGFNYCEEFIAEGRDGHKLVVTIRGIEASPQAIWNQTLYTNNDYSGIWHAETAEGERELAASFVQPATILTSHNYVVDYAKTFVMDLESDIHMTHVRHLDGDDTNRFDEENPAQYLSEEYGNVRIMEGDKISYQAKNMNWDGYDTFYVFGETSSENVLMHSANAAKGNLWSRINVLPANNVYYEDDFVTTEDGDVGIEYSGNWTVVSAGGSGQNSESAGNDVDGWIASMTDDRGDTDGTSHKATTVGATATFTFTGTGVDVYSRTNNESGIIVALLYEGTSILDENGKVKPAKKGMMIDTLSASSAENGDYYQIPTLSFGNLNHGTYTVKIMVNKASANATGRERVLYQLDGIRVYNPLQHLENTDGEESKVVKGAYGEKEIQAQFGTIRDTLIEQNGYGDYTGSNGNMMTGAVFIDKMGDKIGYTESTDINDFVDYGSKNEAYLAPNQLILFAVNYDERASYYVGIKSITGKEAKVTYRYNGQATEKTLSHTADLYYEITPYWQDTNENGELDADDKGLIAIANTGNNLLALTKLKVTNQTPKMATMSLFARMPRQKMLAFANGLDMNEPVPEEPDNSEKEETTSNKETAVPMLDQLSNKLFMGVYDILD